MSTAGGTGSALPVQAQPGPPLTDPQRAALALAEVAAADDRADRARRRLDKVRASVATAEAECEDLLDQAEQEAEAVLSRACDLLDADPEQVTALAAEHAAEQARHDAELTRLLGGDR